MEEIIIKSIYIYAFQYLFLQSFENFLWLVKYIFTINWVRVQTCGFHYAIALCISGGQPQLNWRLCFTGQWYKAITNTVYISFTPITISTIFHKIYWDLHVNLWNKHVHDITSCYCSPFPLQAMLVVERPTIQQNLNFITTNIAL